MLTKKIFLNDKELKLDSVQVSYAGKVFQMGQPMVVAFNENTSGLKFNIISAEYTTGEILSVEELELLNNEFNKNR